MKNPVPAVAQEDTQLSRLVSHGEIGPPVAIEIPDRNRLRPPNPSGSPDAHKRAPAIAEHYSHLTVAASRPRVGHGQVRFAIVIEVGHSETVGPRSGPKPPFFRELACAVAEQQPHAGPENTAISPVTGFTEREVGVAVTVEVSDRDVSDVVRAAYRDPESGPRGEPPEAVPEQHRARPGRSIPRDANDIQVAVTVEVRHGQRPRCVRCQVACAQKPPSSARSNAVGPRSLPDELRLAARDEIRPAVAIEIPHGEEYGVDTHRREARRPRKGRGRARAERRAGGNEEQSGPDNRPATHADHAAPRYRPA